MLEVKVPTVGESITSGILGVWNKWSIAYAISAAFVREGASLILTYQGERQKETVEELGADLHASKIYPCDVTKPEERARSFAALRDGDGYMSEYYFNPDVQRHQIIEYNSPILTVADQFKILTQLENNLMENILGVRVQREEERVSGLYKCQFTLLE